MKQSADKPLVSIIMNCFNGEKYLQRALESIIKQTYSNWELIFWDNQSTDNSKKIFESFKENRFKYYYSPKYFSKLYEARNHAISKTNGEYVAFLDVDDLWTPNKLESQIPLFKDKDVALVFGNFWILDERLGKKNIKKFEKKKFETGFILKNLLKNYYIGILTAVVRKSVINKMEGFNNNFHIIGDFDLFVRISFSWKINCVQEPLAYYRIHSSNESINHFYNQTKELKNWCKTIKDKLPINDKDLTDLKYEIELRDVKEQFNNKKFFNVIKFFLKNLPTKKSIKLLITLIIPIKILNILK